VSDLVARPRTLDPSRLDRLALWLADTLGASRVELADVALLAGGAVQENWRLTARIEGGPRAGVHRWVLRTDAAARLSVSLDRHEEHLCVAVAYAAGVPVAEPIASSPDPEIVGAPFSLQGWLEGTAQGRRIVRDPAIAETGPALAEALGEALARLHAVRPPVASLDFLPLPKPGPALSQVARLRKALDGCSDPRPAAEYVLTWLERHAPETATLGLVHGDFRTGNYMVHEGRLAGVLDWEFCHWGDPYEDIGWLTAPCWRFGARAKEVGGIAALDDLLRGYNRSAAVPVEAGRVPYWQVLASVRWGIIAALQGDRFRTGGEPSLELALTGLMAPEMELDALDLIARIERGERPS
jgi:aminoglycoside phosphotransferase (APT) family kinase protein